jgi:hypothetical protein
MISSRTRRLALGVVLVAGIAAILGAQGRRGAPPPAGARSGTLERATIAGTDATIYLPPSYATDAARRFPVVYVISERPIDAAKDAADKLAAAPGFSEPIVVMSDMPVDNAVADIDKRYRTLAARISRGLAGYAVGGDAALKLAMKRADVFSSLYLLSASIVDATLSAVDGDAANLQRFYGISISVGTRDAPLPVNRRLHDAMTRLRIAHYYEEFDGAHAERISERLETRVLPFFSKNLTAPANPTSPAVQ